MNARELSALMAESAEHIAAHLLREGKKQGREFKAGSIAGEAGNSLSVCVSGAKRGVWKDFATGETGDMLALWCACRSQSVAEAMRDAKRFLGVRDEMPARLMPSYKRPPRPQNAKRPTSAVSDWLSARGLSESTIADFKVAEIVRGDSVYVVLPYLRDGELINAKYRNIADKKDMRQEGGAEPCLFGWHLVPPSARTIAIAEGELDAMSLHQMGICALSVNAGAGNHGWIDSDWDRLERFDEILLCYDADDAGRKGAKEVATRLGLDRCRVVTFGDSKDANDFLLAGADTAAFRACLAAARSFDPDELRSLADFWPGVKALFWPAHEGAHAPFLSFCGQSQLWFEFRYGEVTVWSGYNGHGKSLLLNQVLIGLLDQGERACVFSGEMTPARQGKRLAKQLGGLDRPSPAYLDHMADWVRDRMWIFDLVGTASIDRLLIVFTYAFRRYGIRHFVIDSLMMTDTQSDGPGSITAQKEAMRKLASWARANDTHVHLVAHPRKGQDEKRTPGKQDVSGAGVITDAADNVFSVWSAQKQDVMPGDPEPDGWLELLKQRNGDVQNKRLALFFNREAQQFSTSDSRRAHTYLEYSAQPAQYDAAREGYMQ
ncbi:MULTISPECIES: toprim domain-containing protein [unclassified Caballeronia]|uniref:toprim domain-containing protein n=1 Tax=unclassified Caballeronia TaxID=2646786 RepID=UPI00285468A2|nr:MULTISPECIES: toprim domain-containing protein [unclassified Caballeronia]MDR5777359.1 toprim domain-containing protein [Caballeronia sp. LZ002]MDR5802531.1 toprim domain-containing protein [Caballeronia sp. LZ001]MDR5852797.1 toprim domain-containing protein [Caballeronia sp. LZ003]